MKHLKIFMGTILFSILLVNLSACSHSADKDTATKEQPQSDATTQTHHSASNRKGTANNSTSPSNDAKSQVINRPQGAWVGTFEKKLYKGYHVTPSRYKNIGNGQWEVWVKEINTGQNPYVTVNQKTGDFHG
ncbi:hypothetical protein GCM10011391_33040 [Pullulanibacillus camelliae]|uniref:Lipoprotein n=1 Tax=Pullulanibacillus camelliae TaxID=1707096 RepID=A0A8J2YL15_9BACL|nr:hypothetical protein [Pullulanibacillus camelliae]GGE51642.1 hypothetical protein GCM10011391_33040 [Pullulanibacillus camelliae]